MILLYTGILFLFLFFFSYNKNKNKSILIYMLVVLLLALAPSTNIFGLYQAGFYNLQIVRYLSLLMLPFSLYFLIKNRTIIKYSKKIFITLFILIFTLILSAYIRGGDIPRTYILNVEIFMVVLLYSLSIFSKYPLKSTIIVKNFLLLVSSYAALLSLGTFLYLEPMFWIQKVFYNTYIGSRSVETLFDFAANNRRSYSIFSGANQFSIFSTIVIIFSAYFYRIRMISLNELIVLILSSIIILISSGSRTGLFIYFFVVLLLYFRFKLKYKIISTPFILLSSLLILSFLPERISFAIINPNSFSETLHGQRIDFWLVSWEIITNDLSSLLLGFKEKMYIADEGVHFESGYLQLIGEGGVFSFFSFLFLLFTLYRFKLSKEESVLKVIVLIFFFAEIFMGVFFELKWSIINGILYGYIVSKSYVEYQNNKFSTNKKV